MAAELDNAKKVLENAARPFTAIMGGAKISDKILIIEKLMDKVNQIGRASCRERVCLYV